MKVKVRKNKSVVMIAESEEDNLAVIELLDNLTQKVRHPNPASLLKRINVLRSELPWDDGKGY